MDLGMEPMRPVYREGGAYRPLWVALAALAVGFGLDMALGGGSAHLLGWLAAAILVLGVVAVTCHARARLAAVEVSRLALRVGREVVPLYDISAEALRAGEEAGGMPVGAPVLGGAMSVPKGRVPLPLRLTDGRTVVAPTRSPEALREALLAVLPDRGGRDGAAGGGLGDLRP